MLTWANTWSDVEQARPRVAVLPLGATEQHGTNLPLMTDSLIVTKLAEAVAEAFDAFLLPTIPVGMSATHLAFPGTLSLSQDTLTAVVDDLLCSLERTGFTTVVVLSWHGGNYLLLPKPLESLRQRHRGLTIAVARPGRASGEANIAAGILSPEWHAGEGEASLMAALRPDLVGPDPTDFPDFQAAVARARVTPETGFPQDVRQVSPGGSLGEPSRGNQAKGHAFWDTYVPALIEDLRRQIQP